MLTDEKISSAIATVSTSDNALHEHPDCVRIAYEWLDAQKKIKNPSRTSRSLKHHIERWGGRYVSQDDVTVAAFLHPEIKGNYPFFNISSNLTYPNKLRLQLIPQAMTHKTYQEKNIQQTYKIFE